MAVVLDTSALPAAGAVDRVRAAAGWQEKCSPFPGGHTEELAKSGRRGNCHSSASRLSLQYSAAGVGRRGDADRPY